MKTIPLILGGLLLVSLTACDDDERGRIYTSRDEEACKTLLFTCAPGRQPFFDDDGCGCELIDDDDLNPNTRSDMYDKDRNNNPSLPPTYNNPDGINSNDVERNENRLNNDPIERNLDELQERRLNETD